MSDHPSQPIVWDPKLYDAAHAFVYDAAADLVDVLAPRQGERVLDLGCGTGHLTAKLTAGGADVLGIDASPAMIATARGAFPQTRFDVADARFFRTDHPFDAVFSNAALHWVRPPADAVATVWQALRPGGRFVAEFGGRGNVLLVRDAMDAALRSLAVDPTGLCPWYFPSPGEYASLLEAQGFEVHQLTSFPRPTRLDGPDGLRNWITMFGGMYLQTVPAGQQSRFFERVEEIARSSLHHDNTWHADYHRLRVVAVRG